MRAATALLARLPPRPVPPRLPSVLSCPRIKSSGVPYTLITKHTPTRAASVPQPPTMAMGAHQPAGASVAGTVDPSHTGGPHTGTTQVHTGTHQPAGASVAGTVDPSQGVRPRCTPLAGGGKVYGHEVHSVGVGILHRAREANGADSVGCCGASSSAPLGQSIVWGRGSQQMGLTKKGSTAVCPTLSYYTSRKALGVINEQKCREYPYHTGFLGGKSRLIAIAESNRLLPHVLYPEHCVHIPRATVGSPRPVKALNQT